jgi:TRAP-type C4-dicarboxylate transport system permease small subunit
MNGQSKTTDRAGVKLARFLLAQAPSMLAAAALFFLMIMTFCDVVLRSVANDPIESATELTRICMAIIVFASLPIVSWRSEQIVVDLLDPFYSVPIARIRDILVDLICGAILLWPAWRVVQLAKRALDYGDTTEYLNIPQFYIGYFIAAATMITALVLIVRAVLGVIAPAVVAKSKHDTFTPAEG